MLRLPTLAALLCLLILPALPARAQDGAESATDGTTPGTGEATAADAAPETEEPVDAATAEAMERFADAQGLFDRGDHRGALAELQRVYELLEGSENQYIVLYNLGRVYEELHRYDLAFDTFQSYLDRSPPDAEDRSDTEASLRALERMLGTIAITVDVEHADVWIGEWQVGEAPGEIRVPSGVHQLELRAEGHETVRQQIEVTARSRVEISITMPVLSDFRGLTPALFVSSTVAAVLAAGVGAALGGVALSLSSDAESCGTRVGCVLDVSARRREISDFALGADILFGTAALFAITSVVLIFVTDWGGAPATPEADEASAFLVVPVAGPDGAGVSLHVAF